MASVKASTQGSIEIKNAIARRGWKNSDRPLLEASLILEPEKEWNELGPYAYGCSRQTWERFLQGIPIRDRSFYAFCQVLEIDPDLIQLNLKEDWGEAPDVPVFHGRQQELETLEQWIVRDRHRLISIVGFAGIGKTSLVRGGIGKTDLSLQLVRQIRGEFDCLIWRRLLNAPDPEVLFGEIIEFVSENSEELATTIDGLVSQLLKHLKQRRCLIILDNVESVLQSGDVGENYRLGYEGYRDFFTRVGKSEHSSCVLLTSRVKPRNIEDLEGVHKVRSLELKGLDTVAGRAIFDDLARAYNAGFQGTESDWSRLISFYSGNPLALEIAARYILGRFNGNLADFLQQDIQVFGQIRDLLDWHFERLTGAEKTIMYWLALNREAISITDLKQDLVSVVERKYLPETLDSLERQIPIEKTNTGLTLQPVSIEYMTERAIAKVCQELQSGKLQLFNSHALIKASAKDYIKNSQIRLILQPIIDRLKISLESQVKIKNRLSNLLLRLNRQLPGYSAGNLINLMRYADLNLAGADFSGLTIWQGDLQNLNLHEVNFADCKFANCSLTQYFGSVQAIAFSPNRDLFAVGDSRGGIRLFSLQDWQPCLYLVGHEKDTWVTQIAFSADGQRLASSSMDNTVRLWDTVTGECLKTFRGGDKWIWSVAYSPDGRTIASGGDDNTVKLWDVSTGECQIFTGHDAWVGSVMFHPSNNLLVSSSFDGTVRLWNTDTGKCSRLINAHQNFVLCTKFSPNGEIIASSSMDNTVKVWDANTGQCLNTLTGHTKEIYSIAFNADGETIASGSYDRTVKLWDVDTGELLKTLKGHTVDIRVLAFATGKNLLASGDSSQTLKLWNADTGECLKTWQGYNNRISSLAISPDGRLLACGNLDETVRLWNLETKVAIATLTGHKNWVWTVAFSPDGQTLASCSNDRTIKLWDVRTGECQQTLRGHEGGVWTVAYSPDGQLLVSGGTDGTVRFWNAATGENIRSIPAHSNWVWMVAFSPISHPGDGGQGGILASCSADRTIKLWNVKTGECRLTISDPSSQVISVVFHPNGRMLFSCGDDRTVKLWNLVTGELVQTYTGHTDSIYGLLFFADTNTIVSGSHDATIRFWDLVTGECLRALSNGDSKIRAIALTPDRQTLVSGGTDGTIRLWDLATGQILKLLRPKRPYEDMNITDVKGLTAAQKDALIALGARMSKGG